MATNEPAKGGEAGGDAAVAGPVAADGRRGRVWGIALAAGLSAGLVAWLFGEAVYDTFAPDPELLHSLSGSSELVRQKSDANIKNAALAFGLFGAVLGLVLGLAGGLVRRSLRAGAAAGAVALAAGGAAGVGMALVLLPIMEQNRIGAWDNPLFPLLIHGGIWSTIGAAGGLGFGLAIGGRAAIPRAVLGGALGALLGTFVYDVLVALAFPLAGTSLALSMTWPTRLLARLAVAVLAALGAAGAVQSASGRAPREMKRSLAVILILVWVLGVAEARAGLERIGFNNPGLTVDLAVGLWAWPLPMDYDGDGDLDLVVSCPDKPYNGTYFFENPGGDPRQPVFKPAVRVGPGHPNVQPSYVGGRVRLLVPGRELVQYKESGFSRTAKIYPATNVHPNKVRANQWKLADFDGDGRLDLIVGVGDWTDYGWDDAFDAQGRWTRGPLRGYVYLLRNTAGDDAPAYEPPRRLEAEGEPIGGYGMPSPNLADFDGDGDLDIVCGEFLDQFTYYENVGTRGTPSYAAGRRIEGPGGERVAMDLEMIVPVAIDWDRDGDVDLVVGDEDGRVALVENTGKVVAGVPRFLPPVYFRQQAADVKFGALVTPCSVDWDGDGDVDLICGNSAGYLGWIENLDGGNPPRWAAPRKLEAGDEVIRIMAGPSGSIQGPCEAKWGYTAPCVADWDRDGLPDIVVNSIWGEVLWFHNVGTRKAPKLAPAQPLEVDWPAQTPKPAWTWWDPKGRQLVTQWRTTPAVADVSGDGLPDLVMLDPEGYLALFERVDHGGGRLGLRPGRRVFVSPSHASFDANHVSKGEDGGSLRLNADRAGKSGRRKLCLADWDGDGKLDLLVNSRNVNIFRQGISNDRGDILYRDLGAVDSRILAGHDTAPAVVDWNRDGTLDLLVGAEDGHFYYLEHARR